MDADAYTFVDTNAGSWRPSTQGEGITVMDLGESNGMQMQLVRLEPDTPYPDHIHIDPEFVFMLEGSGRQADQWMTKGWSSVGHPGSRDVAFVSGNDGCLLLSVYGAAEPID